LAETDYTRKFLVLIDDTPECDRAVSFAAHRVKRTGGTLVLLSVIDSADFDQFIGVADTMRAEARNQADHTLYASEKALKDYGDKISADDKAKVEAAIEKLRKAKDAEKADEIKRAIEELSQASHEFSKHLYEEAAKKQQEAQGAQGAAPNGEAPRAAAGSAGKGGPGEEKIIDADFKTK